MACRHNVFVAFKLTFNYEKQTPGVTINKTHLLCKHIDRYRLAKEGVATLLKKVLTNEYIF